ncbi:MAG: zinc ribbon domain-containing protein [Candidatus Symbiothrix sp.]|jgi:predicted amidophosphoribosyltransferase|nr:zinc ribbon domain-containing protein [Candidatus Symbiothrix sp.]
MSDIQQQVQQHTQQKTAVKTQSVTQQSLQCPNCGAMISTADTFCAECGMRVNTNSCAKCGAELDTPHNNFSNLSPGSLEIKIFLSITAVLLIVFLWIIRIKKKE